MYKSLGNWFSSMLCIFQARSYSEAAHKKSQTDVQTDKQRGRFAPNKECGKGFSLILRCVHV